MAWTNGYLNSQFIDRGVFIAFRFIAFRLVGETEHNTDGRK